LAQPRLRLTETALGPISVAVGANGAAQTVEASNIGSGSLALSFSSNTTWLAASAGAQRPCQVALQQSVCIPVVISLSTAALARGSYTGAITVRDPNAIDAPQTITVTVQVGGGVPDTIFLYTQPNGGSDSVRFSTNSVLTTNVTTATGGSWLTVAYEGQGSFRFVQPYRISGTHQPGMPEGTYNGTLQVGGSAFAGDNKSVPVRLVVTSQPIAFLGPEQVRVKYRQGGEPQVVNIGVGNRGRGTLTVGAVTPTLANGSGWMTAAPASGFTGLSITLTPGSLAPGTYRGSVAVAVNAINGPTLTVPVEMEIVANPVPTISTGGVLNNANFAANDPLGVGTIAAVFGEFLADQLAAAPGAPLPPTLSGVRVLVNGRAAPLYFVSPGQINFQVPFETLGGDAIVQVERGGAVGNRVAVNIVPQAGRILVWPGLRHGIIVNADGSLPLPPGVQLGAFPTKAARPGDVLVIYAIGFGQTAPAVASGAASPSGPLAQLSNVIVRFGATTLFDTTIPVAAQFAGLSPGFVGLYQINVQVPRGVPASSEYDLSIQYNNQLSNQVKIAVQP
jgi:uncharacterized protein (TIGR03437 family)